MPLTCDIRFLCSAGVTILTSAAVQVSGEILLPATITLTLFPMSTGENGRQFERSRPKKKAGKSTSMQDIVAIHELGVADKTGTAYGNVKPTQTVGGYARESERLLPSCAGMGHRKRP